MWQRLRFGDAKARRERRKLIEENPFYWLASRDRLLLATAWAVVGVLFVFWVMFLTYSARAAGTKREVCLAMAAFLAYGAFVLWKFLVAMEAARRLSEDRLNGVLELVLVTPLAVEQMITGQRRALNRIFLGPGLAVVLVNVIFLSWAAVHGSGSKPHDILGVSAFFFCVGALLLGADLGAVTCTGMWYGLRARHLRQALLDMFLRVLLWPSLGVAYFTMTLLSGKGLSAEGMYFLLCGWVVLSLLADALVGIEAKDRLDKKFRLAASGDLATRRQARPAPTAEPDCEYRPA